MNSWSLLSRLDSKPCTAAWAAASLSKRAFSAASRSGRICSLRASSAILVDSRSASKAACRLGFSSTHQASRWARSPMSCSWSFCTRVMVDKAAWISWALACRLSTRTKISSIKAVSSALDSTSFRIAFSGSAIAPPRVGPLTRAITEPSLSSLDRSHSQALSRGGRPRLFRKPSGRPASASASAAARVPGGKPGIFDTAPVTW